MDAIGFFSLGVPEQTVDDVNDGLLVFLVKFFNIGQSLQHGPVLDVGNGIHAINEVIKGHLERTGHLFCNLNRWSHARTCR